MAFVLTRIDYLTVGTLSRQTTKIFELKPNKTVQKFAIGDEDGTLYICGKIIYIFLLIVILIIIICNLPLYMINQYVVNSEFTKFNFYP